MVVVAAPPPEHECHRRHHEPCKDYVVRPGHEALFHARDAQIPKSVAATMADAAKLGSSEHSATCIRYRGPRRRIYCSMGRAPQKAECSVCKLAISVASLFAPCGTDAYVCSSCTLKTSASVPTVESDETAATITSRLMSTSRAIPVVELVSEPGGAAELRRLWDSGAVTLVEGGTHVVPDHYHRTFQRARAGIRK